MRRPSPRFIGAFVTAAIVLLVGMVFFFGSSGLLSRTTTFILFFDQSVNGLNEGSAVKFRGVPVGSVSRIMIRADGQVADSSAIPVLIKIDRSRLENDLGVVGSAFKPESLQRLVDKGLFAQLSLESFITGQLFVELSIDAGRSPGPQQHLEETNEYIEIPTLSSSLDAITSDAADIIAELSQLDFQKLNNNVNAVLENLALVLEGVDSVEISRSISGAADSVSAFVASDALQKTMASANATLEELTATLRSYHLENGPLAEALATWTTKLSKTLDGLNALSAQLTAMTQAEGSVRYELTSMLREITRTAQSVRMLADYLESNPNAILTGRPEE